MKILVIDLAYAKRFARVVEFWLKINKEYGKSETKLPFLIHRRERSGNNVFWMHSLSHGEER